MQKASRNNSKEVAANSGQKCTVTYISQRLPTLSVAFSVVYSILSLRCTQEVDSRMAPRYSLIYAAFVHMIGHNYKAVSCWESRWTSSGLTTSFSSLSLRHKLYFERLVHMESQVSSPSHVSKSRHGRQSPNFWAPINHKDMVNYHQSRILVILCKNVCGTCVES